MVLIAFCAAIAAGCSTLGLDRKPVTQEVSADFEAVEQQIAALETELTAVKAERDKLSARLAQLERETKPSQVAASNGVAELKDTPPATITPRTDRTPAPAAAVVSAPGAGDSLGDASATVAPAPRLVQSTLSSNDRPVFENEATGEEIRLASVLWGVHLASYRGEEEAQAGWRKLQRENPNELGLLEPRIERVSVAEKGVFLRLIGGGFASEEKANALCAALVERGLYCRVTSFGGDRLSMATLR